ncbi:MAG: PIN domain-containing protein [Segetibacter sp.]
MLHSSKFTAILDANVLYPAPIRDLLLHLANVELYIPKWTEIIQEEWISNLLLKRTDLKRESLEKTKEAMNAAFPDSNITNFQEIIDSLSLPDKDDRHIVAAAIRSKADVIVTFNIKNFPKGYLKLYDIEAQHPDDFITNLINLNKLKSLEALNNQVKNLRNPPKSKDEVLNTLENSGLKNSVALLKTKKYLL